MIKNIYLCVRVWVWLPSEERRLQPVLTFHHAETGVSAAKQYAAGWLTSPSISAQECWDSRCPGHSAFWEGNQMVGALWLLLSPTEPPPWLQPLVFLRDISFPLITKFSGSP